MTVIVEWLNVSAARDIDVDRDYGYNELLNNGFAAEQAPVPAS